MGIFDRKPNVTGMEKKRDIEGLLEAMKHKDIEVRRNVVGALGRLGDPRAVDPLIKILTGDGGVRFNPDLRLLGDVAKALAEIGDKKAVKALESAAQHSFESLGGFSSLEEAASYAAETKVQIDYFKETVKESLKKLKAKED